MRTPEGEPPVRQVLSEGNPWGRVEGEPPALPVRGAASGGWWARRKQGHHELTESAIAELDRSGEARTRIGWDEVRAFDIRIEREQGLTFGGIDLWADEGHHIHVPHDARAFEAASHLLRSRVLPRLVAESLARIDAGETLRFAPYPRRAAEDPGTPDRIELDRHGLRRVARRDVDIPWRRVDALLLGIDDRIRIEAGGDGIELGSRHEQTLLLLALVTEQLLRRDPAQVSRGRARGWDRAERSNRRAVAWFLLVAVLYATVPIALVLGWAEHRLRSIGGGPYELMLEHGEAGSGTVIALGETTGVGTELTVTFELDGVSHRIEDRHCGERPAVGDTVELLVLREKPELSILVESCLASDRVRMELLREAGRAVAKGAALFAPLVLWFAIANHRARRGLRRRRAAESFASGSGA